MKILLRTNFKRHIACILGAIQIISITLLSPLSSYATTTQEELDKTNQQIDELKEVRDSMGESLSEFNDKLSSVSQTLSELQSSLETKQSDIAQLRIDIEAARQFEETQYEAMKLRIKYMYENGTADTALNLIFSSADMEQFLTRSEYISKMSQYDREMLQKYHDNYVMLTNAEQTLLAEEQELQNLSASATSKQSELENLVNDTQDKISASNEDIALAEQKALEYEKQIEEEVRARQEAERKAAEEAARKAAEEAAAAKKAAEEASRRAEEGSSNNNGNSSIPVTTPAVTVPTPTAPGTLGDGTISAGLTYMESQTVHTLIAYTPTDLAMLAAIIEAEAGNQSYAGKLAVGSVVLNRVNNPRWPSTITDVLYQSGQFTPVRSGRFAIILARGASQSCTQAALEVLTRGSTLNALYFHVPKADETGGILIGDHIFF